MSLAPHGNSRVAGLSMNNRGEPFGRNTSDGTSEISRAAKVVAGLWIALFVSGVFLAASPAAMAAPI